jgi:exopolysaccharide production protein ExoQ
MSPQNASAACVLLILTLFWFDRERKVRISPALWIPSLWLLINGSRQVSLWLDPRATTSAENLEGSPIDAAVFGILVLAALCILAWRRGRTGRILRANAPVLLFFAYCALSVLWSDSPFVAFKRWTKALGDLAVVLVVLTDLNPTVALRRVLAREAFILLPLSVLFIRYYPDIGRTYNHWTWEPAYGGVTLFKNMLGITCLIGGLGSVWSLITAFHERKGRDRLFHMGPHLFITLLAVYLFFTADSMTSFSCFMLGSTLIVLSNLKFIRRGRASLHLAIAILIVIPLIALFLPGANMVQSLGRDPSLTGRTTIWAAVISVVKNPLIGTGFESFWTGDRLPKIWRIINEPGIQEAHDGYLEVYLNLGWIGVTLLATLIVTGYRNVISSFRRDRKAGTIRLAFFVVGLIYSFTEAGFRMMSLVWIAFLLSIVTVPPSKLRKDRPAAGDEVARRPPAESGAACEDAIATI